MRLSRVEIFDYRSIKHDVIDIPKRQLCLVGKNECGKSSIIQAVARLNLLDYELSRSQTNKDSKNYPSGYPQVSGVFDLTKGDYKELAKLITNFSKSSALELEGLDAQGHVLQVKRWGNGISNFSFVLTDKKSYAVNVLRHVADSASFVDEFYKGLYPTIEYFENEDLLLEPATVEDLLGDDSKFETFRRMLQIGGCEDLRMLEHEDDNFLSTLHSNIEDKLNSIFKKHYKQDESIRVSIRTIRENRLNLVIKDASKQSFAIDERSPGFRYYFSFLINKLWAKTRKGSRNSIILLDEPGGNLHPNGAKDLLRSFDEISESSQLLYTTHNPFLTVRNDSNSLIFVSKTPDRGTVTNRKPYLNRYQILRKELGILLNDTFLIGDMNLIVEGATEKLAFHRLFQLEQYRDLEWLNIYDAGGVANISQALNYLGSKNLDLAGIAFLDSDDEATRERGKKGFINAMKEEKWEAMEVNDAFTDNAVRTFEDLFPQSLYVTAFNEYCALLGDSGVFDIVYEPFVYTTALPTPIIQTLQTHFLNFVNEDRRNSNSITKQTVISLLLDRVENMQTAERDAALGVCYKLLDGLKLRFKRVEKYVGQ